MLQLEYADSPFAEAQWDDHDAARLRAAGHDARVAQRVRHEDDVADLQRFTAQRGELRLVLLGDDGATVETRPAAEVRAALDQLIAD